MAETRVLLIGDVSGPSGMGALFLGLSSLIKREKIDFVICNGENADNGFGLSVDDYYKMKELKVNVITSGNHIWQKEEIFPVMEKVDDILRPINYPKGSIGRGCTVKSVNGITYGVINAIGRVSLPATDDPFRVTEAAVKEMRKQTKLIFVDFHAESTEEKEAMGFYLDGKVTAVVGTHTHIQTMDEKILPNGTAYITDIGMTGAQGEVIGSRADKSIERALTQLPIKSEVSLKEGNIMGVIIVADTETGRALEIRRITC